MGADREAAAAEGRRGAAGKRPTDSGGSFRVRVGPAKSVGIERGWSPGRERGKGREVAGVGVGVGEGAGEGPAAVGVAGGRVKRRLGVGR